MSIPGDVSIVEYYAENEGYKCGYCKSPNTNCSHGMWAHALSVQDYQDLIDRGWRRSGCYCYKPTMQLTCCPMYTIKCSVLDFKISKSQKKKMKRFHKYLAFGKRNSTPAEDRTNDQSLDMELGDDCTGGNCDISDLIDLKSKAERAQRNIGIAQVNSVDASFNTRLTDDKVKPVKNMVSTSSSSNPDSHRHTEVEENVAAEIRTKSPINKLTRPGDGIDPNRPTCKKSKLLRKERRERKLAERSSVTATTLRPKTPPGAKSLEDLINEPLPESPAHRLEIRLVRSNPASKEFNSTFKTALEVYQRYQMAIHNDPPEKLTEKQFTRFLVNSPLKPSKPDDGPPQGYGSFHQQYWLDGRLIAVGVIDILPNCVSSVYFFYDPEYHFLVLGTYGSLREVAFCRTLHYSAPSLRYYYMGFYIHSCAKMRYKGSLSPSFLLCPEVYSWHPIEYCIPLLEKNKYFRFNNDPNAKDPDLVANVRNVRVLFQNKAMHYKTYHLFNLLSNDQEEVEQYANLVGNKLSKRMLLIRV